MSLSSFLFTKQKTYPPIGDIIIIMLGIASTVYFNGTLIIYVSIVAISVAFANLNLDMYKYKHHIDNPSKEEASD